MPKKQTADARIDQMRDAFAKHAVELWDAHQDEFLQVLEDSESSRVKLNLHATLDFSDSKAKLATDFSFSQVVKDSRSEVFDDPNAPFLPNVDPEGTKEKKPEAEKPKKGKKGEGKTDTRETTVS